MLGLTAAALTVASALGAIPTVEIAPGVHMPTASIGTSVKPGEDAYAIVSAWLKIGGRGIDAKLYNFDQAKVARAISDAGLNRSHIFITSDIPECAQDPFLTEKAVQDDMKALKTDYIDLMLIGSPLGNGCQESWKVLERMHTKGKLRAIGLSGFGAGHFHTLQKLCGEKQNRCQFRPMVNQIDYSVLHHDEETIGYCRQYNITLESGSPLVKHSALGTRSVLTNPTVLSVAKTHNKTAAQVALRWIVQRGDLFALPASELAHIGTDADVWGFALSDADMVSLNAVDPP